MFKPSLFIEIDKLINEAFFSFSKPADKSFNDYTIGFEFEVKVAEDIREGYDEYNEPEIDWERISEDFYNSSEYLDFQKTIVASWYVENFTYESDVFRIIKTYKAAFPSMGISAYGVPNKEELLSDDANFIDDAYDDLIKEIKENKREYIIENGIGVVLDEDKETIAFVLYNDNEEIIIVSEYNFGEYNREYNHISSLGNYNDITELFEDLTEIDLVGDGTVFIQKMGEKLYKDYNNFYETTLEEVREKWDNRIDLSDYEIKDDESNEDRMKTYLENTIGSVFQRYRVDYDITEDGSLDDEGMEIKTTFDAPNYFTAIKLLKNVFDEIRRDRNLYTDSSCGLHFGLGTFTYEDIKQIDWLKYSLLLGDRKFLEIFDRLNNKYTSEIIPKIIDSIEDKTASFANEKDKINYILSEYIKLFNAEYSRERNMGKYYSVHFNKLSNNYIEIRIAGGDSYEDKFDEMVNLINRNIKAIQAAKDPNLYKEEYYKKLYKLLYKDIKKFDILQQRTYEDLIDYYKERGKPIDEALIRKLLILIKYPETVFYKIYPIIINSYVNRVSSIALLNFILKYNLFKIHRDYIYKITEYTIHLVFNEGLNLKSDEISTIKKYLSLVNKSDVILIIDRALRVLKILKAHQQTKDVTLAYLEDKTALVNKEDLIRYMPQEWDTFMRNLLIKELEVLKNILLYNDEIKNFFIGFMIEKYDY